MPTPTPRILATSAKLSAVVGAAMTLSGCFVAIPPAFQVASLALDGFSYVTTGKSVTDHAISTVTAKDCAMLRGLQGEAVCAENQTQLAMRADGTPAPMANDVAATIKPADEDLVFQNFVAQQNRVAQNQDDVSTPTSTPTSERTLGEILAAAKANGADTELTMETAAGPGE